MRFKILFLILCLKMIIRREPIHCIISKVLPDNKFHIFQTKWDLQSRLEAADSLFASCYGSAAAIHIFSITMDQINRVFHSDFFKTKQKFCMTQTDHHTCLFVHDSPTLFTTNRPNSRHISRSRTTFRISPVEIASPRATGQYHTISLHRHVKWRSYWNLSGVFFILAQRPHSVGLNISLTLCAALWPVWWDTNTLNQMESNHN